MKKIITILLALVLTISSLAMLFSCGEDPCTEHKDDNTDGLCDACGATVEVPPADDIVELIKDGKATFKIVIGSDLSTDMRIKIDEDVVNVLKDLDIDVEVVDDKDSTVSDCEIIFGYATSRGDKYGIDPHYLGSKGYAVKLIGTKVLVQGGSEKALGEAIKHLIKEIFGITGKTKSLESVVMEPEMNFEEIQADYDITSVKIAGNDLKDYVISVNLTDDVDAGIAKSVQTLIYEKTGIWLKTVSLTTDAAKKVVIKTVGEGCEKGFSVVEKDGNLVMECEFPNKFSDAALSFVRSNITTKKGDVVIAKNFSEEKDVRNIYYREFGAKGDGKTDDFAALKAAHDYANKYGHTVNSDLGNTYYIGDAALKNREEIVIKTNVNWEGAKFIFDDAIIPVEYRYAKHLYEGKDVLYTDSAVSNNKQATCSRCIKLIHEDKNGCSVRGDGWHTLSVFSIESDNQQFTVRELIGATIRKGETKFTLADGSTYVPGRTILLKIQDDTKRHYIRYGTNENNGAAQTDLVLVNADGTVDESTPLHWDYTPITGVTGKFADDEPISITSGKTGCIITTKANQGPNYYYSYGRNIEVTRSNVLIQGIKHYIVDEGLPGKGKCPTAFTNTVFANDVTWEDMLFTHQLDHYDASSGAVLGTYEIGANSANKITWRRCDQTNFFEADGSIKRKGFFGTNYCKNFVIEDSVMESFDAHAGAYNVTLIRSTFEHINCVGEGLTYLEDVTVYHASENSIIALRTDYGAPWHGDFYLKNVELKSPTNSNAALSIMNGNWTNHNFGYTCYLPTKITLDNVKITKYEYGIRNGERYENTVSTNAVPLNLYANLNKYTSVDISDPNANMSQYPNDLNQCTCGQPNGTTLISGKPEFNDTNGDGKCDNTIIARRNSGSKVACWGFKDEPDSTKNINPYIPTERLEILNCGNLMFQIPPTPQFANIVVTVDGVEVSVPANGLIKKEN